MDATQPQGVPPGPEPVPSGIRQPGEPLTRTGGRHLAAQPRTWLAVAGRRASSPWPALAAGTENNAWPGRGAIPRRPGARWSSRQLAVFTGCLSPSRLYRESGCRRGRPAGPWRSRCLLPL